MSARATPTLREAMPVTRMTPLFWLKVVFGKVQQSEASRELKPSPKMPPRRRCQYSSPVTGRPDSAAVAVRSPTDSTALTMKMGKSTVTTARSTDKGQRKGSTKNTIARASSTGSATAPRASASTVPTPRPTNTAFTRSAARPLIMTATIAVTTARNSPQGIQRGSFAATAPSWTRSMLSTVTSVSEAPITAMVEPVTTGVTMRPSTCRPRLSSMMRIEHRAADPNSAPSQSADGVAAPLGSCPAR